MRGNHVRRRLKAGEPSIGTWLSLPSPEAAEYCAQLGFDWLTIDAEHNPIDIRTLAHDLQPALAEAVAPRFNVAVVDLLGQIGSGSLPVERLASAGLAIAPAQKKGSGRSLDELARALRALPQPVIGRVSEDRLLLDLRCLEDARPFTAQLAALRASLT